MSDKIRFGVAGLGRIGWAFHCAKLGNHPDCELAAVADTDAARRAEAEEKYGCKAFADFNEMISSGLVDAVTIATPTHLHEAMATAAFAKGLHVILEKPMAPTYEAAERIAAAAEKAGRKLTIYQPHRLNAYFQHIKKIIDSGCIGRIYSAQRSSFTFARRNDWQSLKKFGGGMLNNYGAHFVDQLLQLTGYDVAQLFCSLQLVATMGDADDVVKITYITKQGVVGDLLISQASIAKPYEFVVLGTHGSIEMQGGKLKVRSFDPAELADKCVDESLASADRKYPSDALNIKEEILPVDATLQVDLYADFAKAIRNNASPFVPPTQTLALMKLLAECRRLAGGEADMRG